MNIQNYQNLWGASDEEPSGEAGAALDGRHLSFSKMFVFGLGFTEFIKVAPSVPMMSYTATICLIL